MHRTRVFLVAIVAACAALSASAALAQTPPVAGQVTFLYFDDLARADDFYGNVLGLEKSFDLEWVAPSWEQVAT